MPRFALLAAVVALSAASAVAAPRRLGPWGEDPAVVPDYAPVEERRAPKLYDNTRVFQRLPAREAARLDDALLVCHVSVRGTWDFFGAPDVTLRFVLGKGPAIRLWGPEDHSDFYVSIPRIHLASGDRVDVTAWDRDVTKDEYIGVAHGRYDGQLPLRVTSKWFDLECNAVEPDEALALARPHLDRIDERLSSLEAARPDPALYDYGRPTTDGAIKGRFYVGTMRYAAGALGWDHPEVRARVERLAAAEADWDQRRAAVAATLIDSRRPRGETVEAFGARFTVRRWVCGKQARPLVEAMPASECALVVSVAAPPERPIACSHVQLGGISVAALDRRGNFHTVWPLCATPELSESDLVLAVARAELAALWLSDGKDVVMLGLE